MILSLKNPKTDNYKSLKNLILSEDFSWYYHEISTFDYNLDSECPNKTKYGNLPFYGHTLLDRPDGPKKYKKISEVKSQYFDLGYTVFEEILNFNNYKSGYFYLRMNVNCVHSDTNFQYSMPHVDHRFPHKNIIVYLTNSGGSTIIDDEIYDPMEDDIIMFEGEHYLEKPKKDRRIILVSTIFTDFIGF